MVLGRSALQDLTLTTAISTSLICAGLLPSECTSAFAAEPSMLLTIEFHGPEAASNWYRAGYASSNNAAELHKWWMSKGMLTNFCFASMLSPEDVTNLQHTLEEPEIRQLRSSEKTHDPTQHYLITVRSAETNYYIPLRLDTNALMLIRKLKAAVSDSASEPTARIEKQLSFFLGESK